MMRVVFTWFLLAGLAGTAFAGAPAGASLYLEPESKASITVTPVAERWMGDGFLPVRARIENRADSARVWTLRFSAWTEYNENTDHAVTVPVGPREVAETVVFVPGNRRAGAGGSAWVRVEAEGPGARGGGTQVVSRNGGPPAIITAVSAAQEVALFAVTRGGSGGPEGALSVVDAAAWPADRRVWSPFERVVLTDAEFARLDGARRAALREWVTLGGVLDLFPDRAGSARPADERLGLGIIRRARWTLGEEQKTPGFGYLPHDAGVGPAGPATITPERRAELAPGTGRLGLSLFLLGFGLLVGPANVLFFAPARRRQRLFVTVPVISLAASALMAGYIVAQDGFGGEGSQRGVILLAPEANQAVVVQNQVSRTGVLLGGGFALPEDVELAQAEEAAAKAGGGGGRPLRYARDGDGASGRWFASRRVQGQALRRLVPTRARIERVGGGPGAENPPVVQSSVGATLRGFVYRDAGGALWAADEVPPGARVPLRAAKPGGGTPRRGEFMAYGGAAEGLAPIPTLSSIRWDEPVFLYTGPLSEVRTP